MKRTIVFDIVFLCLLTFVQLSHNQETRPGKCSLHDSVCLTTQAQNTLQAFVEGIPSLGIKTIDKLLLDPIIVNNGNLTLEWDDIKVSGLKNAIIDDVSINMFLKILRVSFHTTVEMDCKFSADGVVFSAFEVHGSGPGKITLKKIQMELLFVFDIAKDNNGKDFMDLKTYYYGFDTDGVEYYAEDLFKGDKKKTQMLVQFCNENWRTTLSNFGGYFNRKLTDELFREVKTYMRLPLEEIAIY